MFPFVTCEFTGRTRPGYAICAHIPHGAPVAELRAATDDEMGAVCCMLCAKRGIERDADLVNAYQFSLECADCAEMNLTEKVGHA